MATKIKIVPHGLTVGLATVQSGRLAQPVGPARLTGFLSTIPTLIPILLRYLIENSEEGYSDAFGGFSTLMGFF
jgi:hypothetical protein